MYIKTYIHVHKYLIDNYYLDARPGPLMELAIYTYIIYSFTHK